MALSWLVLPLLLPPPPELPLCQAPALPWLPAPGPLCTHGLGSSSPSGLTQWIGGKQRHRGGKTLNKTEIKAVLQR